MLRLAEDVRFRRLLDEGVLLRLASGEILGVNGVGARVVELLSAGESSRARMAEVLRTELDVPPATDVESDVEEFVGQLVEIGAVLDDGEHTP